MSRTLLLMRHAKSSYPDGVVDHDRPLAERGLREAPLAGEWIRAQQPPVDAVLCSSATRTRQTLERTGVDAPVEYLEALYDATPGAVLAAINAAPKKAKTLLVVGHEPTTSSLALGLADDDSDAAATHEIAGKFPTSAIAVLHTDAAWADLELGGATLVAFHVPR
jgi:phosphohistidine phosphatase